MKATTEKKIINAIVYTILAALAAALFYAAYLEMVAQGKAERIEVLREKIKETEAIADQRDSVTAILQDSAHVITTY
ncbi:MAG: hypothetical protein ACOYIG_03350 [Acetivibrionales bacterium]|jgi:hypothetical protein